MRQSDGLYTIDSIPFFVVGVSTGDVVTAENVDGELKFKALVRLSKNSTFRVIPNDSSTIDDVRGSLMQLGCRVEVHRSIGLLAAEVAGTMNIEPFLEFLVEGKETGRLDFEEAALRHALEDPSDQ